MWTTPSGVEKRPSDSHIRAISERPNDFRVLECVPLKQDDIPITFREPQNNDTTIVVVDCETTGLGYDDRIIELGMVRCRYSESGDLVSVDEKLSMFQDPHKPIPPEVTKITGITDDMVRDKDIDKSKVQKILRDDPWIVAHNARFDRPLFEQLFPNDDHRWACTMVGIPWVVLGHDSSSLGIIMQREGWFFDAHRAVVDCLAVAWLLHVVPDSLQVLLASTVKVMAIGAPFRFKDTLKRRGYSWDPNPNSKYWHVQCCAADVDAELAYLEQFYIGKSQARARKLNPRTNFK